MAVPNLDDWAEIASIDHWGQGRTTKDRQESTKLRRFEYAVA